MVDDINSQDAEALVGEPKPKPAIVTFFGTSTGRLVLGGTVVFLAVVAIGALAFFFLLNPTADVTSTTPNSKQVSQTTTLSAPPVNPPEAPLKDTFTFRNIFAPSVHPVTPSTSTETSTGTGTSGETPGTGSTSTTSNALVLESIVTDSGVRVATFSWKGTTYEVTEGDVIGTSPWKVLELYSDSALLLYGDSRVTLSVGQGFSTSTEPVSK